MKFTELPVKLILWLQPAALMALDAWAALQLYRYAWTLREPGWLFFTTPLAKLYTDVQHEEWLVVVSLLLAFQIFGIYQLHGRTILRLLSGLAGAIVLQAIFLTQFMTLSRGGPEEFPRSVFVVLAILLLAVVPMYRLPLWLALKFGLKFRPAGHEAAPAPKTEDFTRPERPEASLLAPAEQGLELALDAVETDVSRQQHFAETISQLEATLQTLQSKLFRLRPNLLEASPAEAASLRLLLKRLEKEEWETMGQLVAHKVLFTQRMHDIRAARDKVHTALLNSQREMELQRLKEKLGTDFAGEDMERQMEALGADIRAKQGLLAELDRLADFGRVRVLGLRREEGTWSAIQAVAFRYALRTRHYFYRKADFAPDAVRMVLRDFPTFCIFLWGGLYLLCFLLLLADLVMTADIIASFAFLLLLAAVAGWTYEHFRHSRWRSAAESSGGTGNLEGEELASRGPENGRID